MLYKATDTDLTVVADAIRRKDGTESPLTFPAEYIAHIEAITTGDDGKSAILIAIDTGSTVTVTGGGQNYTAQEENGLWLFPKLVPGTYTAQATKGGMTASQTITIPDDYSRRFVYYVEMGYRTVPVFTYTGSYQIVTDNDTAITNPETYTGNWKIRFLTSGTLTMQNLCGARNGIDVFLVGGGGGGRDGRSGGGGGGYTNTARRVSVSTASYPITIGAGGAIQANGGQTAAFGSTAGGGNTAPGAAGGAGGSGGGGAPNWAGNETGSGGAGGSDGGNGVASSSGAGGAGQGTTTREFGEAGKRLYAGGGGAGGGGGQNGYAGGTGGAGGAGGGGAGATGQKSNATAGEANTGGGGGGASGKGGISAAAGGSGIVIIRNTR